MVNLTVQEKKSSFQIRSLCFDIGRVSLFPFVYFIPVVSLFLS